MLGSSDGNDLPVNKHLISTLNILKVVQIMMNWHRCLWKCNMVLVGQPDPNLDRRRRKPCGPVLLPTQGRPGQGEVCPLVSGTG